MKQYPSLTITLAIVCGLVVSFLDMAMGYAQLPYIIVLVGAALLSMFNTKRSWLIALILGGSIPLVHGASKLFGIESLYPFQSLGEWIMPIVLAFGGSMIGVRVSASWMKTPLDTVWDEQQD